MIHSSVRMESISLRDDEQKLLLLISLGFFLEAKDHCGRLNEPRKERPVMHHRVYVHTMALIY